MKLTQRIDRVEEASQEAQYRAYAEELAAEWGQPVEQVLHHLLEIHDRIVREGLGAEIRHIASECGQTEKQVWEDFNRQMAKVQRLTDECD